MPEHFLALIKQSANLTSNIEAERSAVAIVSALEATLDTQIYTQIERNLPIYLQPTTKRRFFLHRKIELKQFNQQIFLDRVMHILKLTDQSEAENRVSAFMTTLKIIQPNIAKKLSSSLPTDLNIYW